MSRESAGVEDGSMETVSRSERIGRKLGLGDWAFSGVSQLLLLVWAFLVIFPFLWMLMTSFKSDQEILFSPWRIPHHLYWDNFARAWNQAHIGRYFLNTLIVLSGSLTGTLLISAMASYVLARFEFPGRGFIFILFVVGLMFPVFLALVPLFSSCKICTCRAPTRA